MSSHREAPEISKDPVADSTDLYAFVSPDSPDTVTLIANYIPLQGPDGGPNFYEFGDDVIYDINIDNNGDALAGHHIQVQVHECSHEPRHLLVQHRPYRVFGLTELEPSSVLLGVGRGRLGEGAGDCEQSSVSAVPDRSTVNAQLRKACRGGRPAAPRRDQGLRRAACRRLLCGLGCDIRSRRSRVPSNSCTHISA